MNMETLKLIFMILGCVAFAGFIILLIVWIFTPSINYEEVNRCEVELQNREISDIRIMLLDHINSTLSNEIKEEPRTFKSIMRAYDKIYELEKENQKLIAERNKALEDYKQLLDKWNNTPQYVTTPNLLGYIDFAKIMREAVEFERDKAHIQIDVLKKKNAGLLDSVKEMAKQICELNERLENQKDSK